MRLISISFITNYYANHNNINNKKRNGESNFEDILDSDNLIDQKEDSVNDLLQSYHT